MVENNHINKPSLMKSIKQAEEPKTNGIHNSTINQSNKISEEELRQIYHAKLFKKRLQYLYKKIDADSSLLWGHENSLGVKKLRSEIQIEDNELKWKNKDTTQTGYGEITLGSMTALFNLLQSISILLESLPMAGNELKSYEDYNMTSDSVFLDIGSGFGKPVFHAAFQTGCTAKGIEVVPARAEFTLDFYYEYFNGNNFFEDMEDMFLDKHSQFVSENMLKEIICEEYTLLNDNITDDNSVSLKTIVDFSDIYYLPYLKTLFGNRKTNNVFLGQKSIQMFENNFNKELRYDNDFFNLKRFQVGRSILCDDKSMQFDQIYMTSEIEVEISPISEYIFSLVNKILINKTYPSKQEQDILFRVTGFDFMSLKVRSLFEVIFKIENMHMLNLVEYFNFLLPNNNPGYIQFSDSILVPFKLKTYKHNDLKSLKNELRSAPIYHSDEVPQLKLKECLSKLRFSYRKKWYDSIIFKSNDATKYSYYSNEINDRHCTHIYAYNKLMSKECRKKIAKILNQTRYKILAWYSNPKQTIKAGLKNFVFLCKFPMQSTSTEKFHVYVYARTK